MTASATLPSRRRRGWTLGALIAVALTALLLSDWPAAFLVLEDPASRVDAIVVMAGDPDYERTRTAAALIRAHGGDLLILTGGQRGPGDSAESLRTKAVELGVAPERIRVETTSHSTREAVIAVAPLLRSANARTVALVTSPYHERRATAAARRAWPGVTVLSRPASPSSWTPSRWWSESRSRRIVATEYVKLAYYAMRGWL